VTGSSVIIALLLLVGSSVGVQWTSTAVSHVTTAPFRADDHPPRLSDGEGLCGASAAGVTLRRGIVRLATDIKRSVTIWHPCYIPTVHVSARMGGFGSRCG
jgi:hypothetical protein